MKIRRNVYQAIADPTRRAIIALIALHAMTPNAIAKHLTPHGKLYPNTCIF